MVSKNSVHKKTIITEVIEKKPSKKKTTKKKTTKKKAVRKKAPKKTSVKDTKIEKALVENFISLQKVMVNLSIKFDNLTNHISKLLDLFEISAKALAEKDFDLKKSAKDGGEVSKKMDALLDQNKIIARGLTLMHDRVEEKLPFPDQNPPVHPPKNPQMQNQMRKINSPQGFQGYQKSISSNSMENQ